MVETSSAHVPQRFALAVAYANVCRSQLNYDDYASRSVAAGNAVLAGIAAADVLCIAHLGVRSASTNHSDAVALLKRIDPEAARDLAILIRDKTQAHYGISPVDKDSLTRMVRSMERLIERANNARTKIKPR